MLRETLIYRQIRYGVNNHQTLAYLKIPFPEPHIVPERRVRQSTGYVHGWCGTRQKPLVFTQVVRDTCRNFVTALRFDCPSPNASSTARRLLAGKPWIASRRHTYGPQQLAPLNTHDLEPEVCRTSRA